MPTSANCPKNPGDARADVGIRAPILPLSQQPYVAQTFLSTGSNDFSAFAARQSAAPARRRPVARPSPTFNHTQYKCRRETSLDESTIAG